MIKLVCISDTHCKLNRVKLPDGDILVHAGDALSRGTLSEFIHFINQLENIKVKYKHVIYVPGNHDIISEKNETLVREECEARGIIYLNNEGITLEGIEFYGSGITPRFHNWGWNKDSGDCGTSYPPEHKSYDPIEPYWDAIPSTVDVLITHGPPRGIMDLSVYSGDLCGCPYLLDKVMEIKPVYHIFGHIHFFGGQKEKVNGVTFVNASICTEQYVPKNSPTVLEIKNEKKIS